MMKEHLLLISRNTWKEYSKDSKWKHASQSQGRRFESLPENETPVDVQSYQMAVDCLTYATTANRPD